MNDVRAGSMWTLATLGLALGATVLAGCGEDATSVVPSVTDALGAADGAAAGTDDVAATGDGLGADGASGGDAVGDPGGGTDDAVGNELTPADDALITDDALLAADGTVAETAVGDDTVIATDAPVGTDVSVDLCAGKVCNDGNDCTTDSCEPTKGCQYVAVAGCKGGVCSNDDTCKGAGQVCDMATHICVDCTASKGCGAGTVCEGGKCAPATGCGSDKDCKATNQVCELGTKICVDCLSANDCASGLACVAHKCATQTKCVSSKDCPAVCDKANGLCVDCLADGDCKPNQFCGSNKTCHADVCAASVCSTQGFYACAANGSAFAAPVLCDDGSPCTTDTCDTSAGCKFTPQVDGTVCGGDGALCGALATCQAGKCVPKQAAGCDDGNVCTADVCDPKTGCVHTAQAGGKCTAGKDGSPCTSGTVACLASGLCGEGPAPGWVCCGGVFGGACDGETAGWTLSGDAATAEKVGDSKSADAGADFLVVGTQPTESGKDGSATHPLASVGQGGGVITLNIQVISEEFGKGCGQQNGQSYQDSLTIQIDGKTVLTLVVGDFCSKVGLNVATGAKGTYPMGLTDAGQTPTGAQAQRTPWIVLHVPVGGLNPNAPMNVTVTAKSVGDNKSRTLFLVDGLKLETSAAASCSGDSCCQTAAACDVCANGTTCGTCLNNDCDGDGVVTATDNCPTLSNADQKNADGDVFGDACDPAACIKSTCTDPLKQQCTMASAVPNCCKSANDCGDGNPCTTPQCNGGSCSQQNVNGCCQFDSQCSDKDPCTKDSCSQNKCSHQDIPGCG